MKKINNLKIKKIKLLSHDKTYVWHVEILPGTKTIDDLTKFY